MGLHIIFNNMSVIS